jgi:hypothetical protein
LFKKTWMLLVRKNSAGNEDLVYIAFALGSNLFDR